MDESLIILGALGFFAILIPFAIWRLKSLRTKGIAEMKARLGEASIRMLDPRAVYYGLASRGVMQPRELGGIWAVSTDQMVFKSFNYGGPSSIDLVVPLSQVRTLDVRSNFQHMGKNIVGGLLVIGFGPDGPTEEVAFRLDDRVAAEACIRQLTGLGA